MPTAKRNVLNNKLRLLEIAVLIVFVSTMISALLWGKFIPNHLHNAEQLPRDLASAGFVLADTFSAKNQMKLQELPFDEPQLQKEVGMAQSGFRGGNFMACLDENNRLVQLLLLADSDTWVMKPELTMVEVKTAQLHLSLLEFTRRDLIISYGNPSWCPTKSSAYYDFAKDTGELFEVMFLFNLKGKPQDTDKLMGISYFLFEGDKAKEQHELIKQYNGTIYKWPLQ